MTPSVTQSKSPFAPVVPAAVSAATAVATFVRAAWRAYCNRRAVVELLQVNDHMLRDLGLTRGDVHASLACPLLEDPSARLRVFAVERRAARRAQARERLEAGAPVASPSSAVSAAAM